MKLQLRGSNLDIVSRVKIADAAGMESNGTIVSKTATGLSCEIPVSAATTPPGPWNIVVDDGGSKSFTLQGKLTIDP